MIREVLYGIAVADAIGNPLEFLSKVSSKDFKKSMHANQLRVSDDTQMSLFLAESLWSLPRLISPDRRLQALTKGYIHWFITQRTRPSVSTSYGSLAYYEELYSVEAPGRTCMSALSSIVAGLPVVNDSKGNGTVMRCAPVAYYALQGGMSREQAFAIAAMDAEITHKHSRAALSSMVLVGIHYLLGLGVGFVDAVTMAVADVGRYSKTKDTECLSMFTSALSPEWLSSAKKALGGWVAEEALALAIGAVACNQDYLSVIEDAITIGGDSDTVGGVAGGLAAAAELTAPESLKAKLNVLRPIEHVLKLSEGVG